MSAPPPSTNPGEPAGGTPPAPPGPPGYPPRHENAPGAVGSLVCGILGLFTIPLVLSIVAVVLGNQSKRATAAEPHRYTDQFGQIGRILGWIGIGLAGFGLIVLVAALLYVMPLTTG